MKRKIFNELVEWKNSKYRMPLLLTGARQVGKTYIINEFGKKQYKNFVYFNLEKQIEIHDVFNGDLDPLKIIKFLELKSASKIEPDSTLIILDEIQACPRALTSLKYFKEEHNEYHIIATGSLLGIAINRGGFSFPVGCVQRKTLYPLDFEEFLMALNENNMIDIISSSFTKMMSLPKSIHELAMDLYKKYLYIGGMPDAINKYIESKNLILVREKQIEIINSYFNDLGKYNTSINAIKSKIIFNNISQQLAKENKKFKYSLLKTGARASEYEIALDWVCTYGIAQQIFKLNTIRQPINAYISLSEFKLYLNDVGLLCAMHNVKHGDIVNNNLNEFMGGLVENYVFNQLKVNQIQTYYWTSKYDAEIDFLFQDNLNIIPIEVKSNTNNHSASLNSYIKQFKPQYGIRISARNFGFENNIKSIPLYATFCLKNKLKKTKHEA